MKKIIAIIIVVAIVLIGVGGVLIYKGYKDGYFTPEFIEKTYFYFLYTIKFKNH